MAKGISLFQPSRDSYSELRADVGMESMGWDGLGAPLPPAGLTLSTELMGRGERKVMRSTDALLGECWVVEVGLLFEALRFPTCLWKDSCGN